MLVRNFERIALLNEYAEGPLLVQNRDQTIGSIRRWSSPVRVDVSFGASVSPARREEDLAALRTYVRRLARVTGHPITYAPSGNFHVLFMSADDTDEMEAVLRDKVPGISERAITTLKTLPRTQHCVVVTYGAGETKDTLVRAVALIRAEHPDLLRLACIHEELSQGLGLINDSDGARPSIFNDDDEFALLTSHDEKLLAMLYDPRLRPGMNADQALPVARILAREAMGQEL